MKLFKIDPNSKIEHEIKSHDNEESKKITAGKTKKRKRNIRQIKTIFPTASKILCVGCRDNSEVKDFIDLGFNAIGIDLFNETKYIKKIDAHNMISHFGNKKFDVIYSSHSLEHMYNASEVLDQFRKISKLGVFIVLPVGGKRKGMDLDVPNITHPSVFDIMINCPKNKKELNKNIKILNDFKNISPYSIEYYKISGNDIEICFKFT